MTPWPLLLSLSPGGYELPEVEAQRRLIEKHAVGAMIDSVVATEQGGGPLDGEFDAKVIPEGVEAGGLEGAIEGLYIIGVKRVGSATSHVLLTGVARKERVCVICLLGFFFALCLVCVAVSFRVW